MGEFSLCKGEITLDIDNLSVLSPTFDEDEEKTLDALPRNKKGLSKLLSHLESFDSLNAWCFLFQEYSDLLSDDQLWWLKDRASSIFDGEILSALLPDVFESD